MRLLKKPQEQKKIQEPIKAIIKATYLNNIEPKKYTQKNYQIQTVDGLVEKIKLCIGKPNYFQNSKPIFVSKVKGVFYEVFANVCKTPTTEMVVGVKIVDPVLGHTLDIEGYNFTKEDGVLQFIDTVHDRQVGANIIQEVPK